MRNAHIAKERYIRKREDAPYNLATASQNYALVALTGPAPGVNLYPPTAPLYNTTRGLSTSMRYAYLYCLSVIVCASGSRLSRQIIRVSAES